MNDYSDPHRNYLRIFETINYLIETPNPPQSWINLQYLHMCAYRKHFPEFAVIHPEMGSESFRKVLVESDDLLDRMITLYEFHRVFDMSDYLKFNKNLAYIVKEIYSMDECMDLMSGLGF